MDFNFEPSLAYQASVVIVSSMWCREFEKHLCSIKLLPNRKYDRTWLQEHSSNIAMHLEDLKIPTIIKQHLLDIFLPIGHHIFTYLEYNDILNASFLPFSELLVWSHQGTIDLKATAEKLLKKKEKICTYDRFIIACQNCVYDEILELWTEVNVLYNRSVIIWDNMEVLYWAYHLKNEIRNLMRMTEYNGECNLEFALWVAVESQNHIFAKYFIEQSESHKLVKVIKNAYSSLIVKSVNNNPLLAVYLLSCLSENDQMEVFLQEPEKNLRLFTNWPLQNYFLKLANKLWNLLTPISFYNIVDELARKASEYHWGQMYENIFIEFWNGAPLSHKNYVIGKCRKSPFLSRIFALDNSDSIITFLLSVMSPTNKLEMLLGFYGRSVVSYLLSKNRFTSLELFIGNCVTTRDDINNLRKGYTDHVTPFYMMITKEALIEFYKILKNMSEKLN